jgi:hypothetical protein
MVRYTAKKTTLGRVGQDYGDGCERMVTRLAFKFFVATAMAQSSIGHNVRYMDAITCSEYGDAGFFQPPKGVACSSLAPCTAREKRKIR